MRPLFVKGKQTTGDGKCAVWEVCPLVRPLMKLDKEKYQNVDSTPLSMLNPLRLRVPVEVPAKIWLKIEISSNCIKIGAKPISSTLITNMDKDFENIVAKVPKMAQKVAQMS